MLLNSCKYFIHSEAVLFAILYTRVLHAQSSSLKYWWWETSNSSITIFVDPIV
jgi:hypothetical protein